MAHFGIDAGSAAGLCALAVATYAAYQNRRLAHDQVRIAAKHAQSTIDAAEASALPALIETLAHRVDQLEEGNFNLARANLEMIEEIGALKREIAELRQAVENKTREHRDCEKRVAELMERIRQLEQLEQARATSV